jgi:hypothetical protein
MSHLTRNRPGQHAVAAAGNGLVKTRERRCMPGDRFRGKWDTLYDTTSLRALLPSTCNIMKNFHENRYEKHAFTLSSCVM